MTESAAMRLLVYVMNKNKQFTSISKEVLFLYPKFKKEVNFMKKLFISQPMRGKTDEEILRERNEAITIAKDIMKDDIEVIDSFFQNAPAETKPLWFLGKSIELLSSADVVYFCKGWNDARGCRIEHECAKEYGIDIIEQLIKHFTEVLFICPVRSRTVQA